MMLTTSLSAAALKVPLDDLMLVTHGKSFTGYPCVLLWRRRTDEVPLPYIMAVIGTGRLMFQIPVPLSRRDEYLHGCTVTVPRAGHVAFPPYLLGCEGRHMLLGSPQSVRDGTYQAVIKLGQPPGPIPPAHPPGPSAPKSHRADGRES
jgi:hypothetical protein